MRERERGSWWRVRGVVGFHLFYMCSPVEHLMGLKFPYWARIECSGGHDEVRMRVTTVKDISGGRREISNICHY
jgi:hypothetical protein